MGVVCRARFQRAGVRLLPLIFAVLVGWPDGARAELVLSRTDTGQAVPADRLEAVLPETGVAAKMDDGTRLNVFGIELVAQGETQTFLAMSSQSFVAASLLGQVASGTEAAEPGQVLIFDLDSSEPETFYFDVERFLATSPLAQDAMVRASLESVAASHERLKFWGLIRTVGLNARAPVSPSIEEIRRSYLLAPTVVRLRSQAAGDEDRLAGLVAAEFARGVASKELEPVKSLLSPELFQSESRPYDRNTWQILRARFAEAMLDGPLPQDLAASRVEAIGGDSKLFRIVGGQRTYTLSVIRLDGMVFVEGLEPEEGTS